MASPRSTSPAPVSRHALPDHALTGPAAPEQRTASLLPRASDWDHLVVPRRHELRGRLEDLLGINSAQLPSQALAAMRELWATCDRMLGEWLPDAEPVHQFLDMVGLLRGVVEQHIHPWLDVQRPWLGVRRVPTEEADRIELAATVLRLCMDLQGLADLMHPDLRIRQVSTSWFASWAGRVVTLQAVYLHEADLPKVYSPPPGPGLH